MFLEEDNVSPLFTRKLDYYVRNRTKITNLSTRARNTLNFSFGAEVRLKTEGEEQVGHIVRMKTQKILLA